MNAGQGMLPMSGKEKEQVGQQKKKKSRVEVSTEYSIQSRWFHVLADPILRGDLANLTGSEFKVLMTIKAHSNHATGFAFPSMKKIASLTGLSEPTTKRAVKSLKSEGYIKVGKEKRSNNYRVIESLIVEKNGSAETEQMMFDYVPSDMQKQLIAIKEFCTNGDTNITINVQVNNTQNNFFGQPEEQLSKDEIDALFQEAAAS